MLPRHARCVLSRLRCNGHSVLLGSCLSKIGRIENPSCSAFGHPSQDTSHLILHCRAADSLRHSLFGDSLSLRPLVQTLGSCPASGAPWSSTMPPSLGRGRVTNNNNSMPLSVQTCFLPGFSKKDIKFKLCFHCVCDSIRNQSTTITVEPRFATTSTTRPPGYQDHYSVVPSNLLW